MVWSETESGVFGGCASGSICQAKATLTRIRLVEARESVFDLAG
jgi:hypothetical protein